jgi:hypothetical protein
MGNKAAIDDIYVVEGIAAIAKTQVILIETFDQALEIAKAKKTEAIQKALDDYAMVQKAIENNAANASHPKVLATLKTVLDAIPNHESAKLIALHGSGRGPKKLSLAGSLDAIQKAAVDLNTTMQNGTYKDDGKNDPLSANVALLNRLRTDVDDRTKSYLDAFLKTANFVRQNRARKQWTSAMDQELKEHATEIGAEEQKLMNNAQIREELMPQ